MYIHTTTYMYVYALIYVSMGVSFIVTDDYSRVIDFHVRTRAQVTEMCNRP